ncbi:uncharacterized protein ASPGLDRAFT_634660 [Aspergillus glaucus CBS 516.65]|uniref:Uncharacterized protein n=1 Tax=Aspergillus glaucus CBS 516.65 TaxID=1160497 RepID=A0A1L9VCD9_ASPGL|nr:hypothetical protein ASPGLDRAFT_634660 [Aspergillus glaucus CBS 516.65]OJJ81611.1 hypothetical protein ASPGLDRAFT_634660 [Aspergillus glaucus CBS 516.65]
MHEADEYLAAMEIDFRSCLDYDIDKEYRPDAAQSVRFLIPWDHLLRVNLFDIIPRFFEARRFGDCPREDLLNGTRNAGPHGRRSRI